MLRTLCGASSKTQITDEDVLDVLDRWYFAKNTARANVFPIGVQSVESDTLGLVRSRTGRVTATSITRKAPAVFELLARWLAENLPPIFERSGAQDLYTDPAPVPSRRLHLR